MARRRPRRPAGPAQRPTLTTISAAHHHPTPMTEPEQDTGELPRHERRPVGGDLILPLAGLIFTIYYFVTIWDLTWEAKINGFFVGSVLILLIAIFLVRTALRLRRRQVTLGLGSLLWPLDVQARRVALLALSIAFILSIEWLGFTLATWLFLLTSLYALGVRDRLRLIGLPLAWAVAGYLLFIVALDTRFPHGPIERLLEALF